jgi:hypothetical protein
MEKRSRFVFSLLFAAGLWTFGTAQAQDIITNAAQFAAVFDQPGLCYPLASPFDGNFQPMDTWFVDFSAITNAFAAITNYNWEIQQGVVAYPLRLVQFAETGEVAVKPGTNDVELLRLSAPAGYVPYATYSETLRAWALFFGQGYTSYDDLIAVGDTFLYPPRVVLDVWAISAADLGTYMWNGSSSETTSPTVMYGNALAQPMDAGACSITNDTQPFSFLDIYMDNNGYTTVDFESCTNYLYGVLSTDELSTNTVWQTRAFLWGMIGSTGWTDTTTTNVDHRFYKALRMPPPNEWYGPFASWTNVLAFPGVIGDGSHDDTSGISNALASVGLGNCSPVLYFPSGHTYRVTQKLWLRNRQYVEIVGQDRDTTIIQYDGPMGTWEGYMGPATLFHADGLAESHIARLTFDGNNKANTIFGHSVTSGGFFDEGNSIVDCVFKNSVNDEGTNEGHGVDAGFYGDGFADVDFTRCIFTNTSIGLYTWNANALDGWLTDCYLVDNIFGVFLLLGSAHAYHSTFSNREADFILYQQAINFISLVGNTSYRSGVFFLENSSSGNQTPTLLKGNTIIDPSPDAIEMNQPGPLFLIDNVIACTNAPAVSFLDTRANLIGIGNTNVVPNWLFFDPNSAIASNLVDNYVVARSNLTFTMPPPPASATNLNRIVVEMGTNFASSDLQTAINNAADGTVIHIPWVSDNFGSIPITQTITMPTNKDIRIVGDGYNTKLAWNGPTGGTMFSLPHPSHITFAHLQLYGYGSSGPLIAVSGVGSSSARVYAHDT